MLLLALVIAALVLTVLNAAGLVVVFVDNRRMRAELDETRGDYLQERHAIAEHCFRTDAQLMEFDERQRRLVEGLGAAIGVSLDSEVR